MRFFIYLVVFSTAVIIASVPAQPNQVKQNDELVLARQHDMENRNEVQQLQLHSQKNDELVLSRQHDMESRNEIQQLQRHKAMLRRQAGAKETLKKVKKVWGCGWCWSICPIHCLSLWIKYAAEEGRE